MENTKEKVWSTTQNLRLPALTEKIFFENLTEAQKTDLIISKNRRSELGLSNLNNKIKTKNFTLIKKTDRFTIFTNHNFTPLDYREIYNSNNEYIGKIYLHMCDRLPLYISIFLEKDFQGKGYGAEILLSYANTMLKSTIYQVKSLHCHVDSTNINSRKLFEKIHAEDCSSSNNFNFEINQDTIDKSIKDQKLSYIFKDNPVFRTPKNEDMVYKNNSQLETNSKTLN